MPTPEVRKVRFEFRDSDAQWLKAEFRGEGHLPKEPPNPAYPDGVALDLSEGAKSCAMALKYPAPQVGKRIVDCASCRTVIVVSAAGRPDDPRSIRIACKLRAPAT